MSGSLRRTDAARYKIEELLSLVQTGRVRIPRFQRGLRWTATDVERLFDSIYKGYPIGTLLFWKRPAGEARLELGSVVIDAPERSDALWVVDGQQRITSLAASLLPSHDARSAEAFDLAFDLATERFMTRRPHDKRETRIPLRQAYDLQQVLGWLRERALDEVLEERAFRLADRLRNYEIPAYIVEAEDEQALRQIFDRTNTFGKQMTRAEVFHALHTAASPGARDLRSLGDEVAALGYGEFTDNTLLFCVLSVRGPDVLREFRSEFESEADLAAAFDQARSAIGRMVDFLRNEAAVPHLSLIPYQHLTVGLTRFFSLHPAPDDWCRVLLRRWFWRSAVHGPIAKIGSTGTLRATMNAISSDSTYESVRALLELVSDEAKHPALGSFGWKIADARIGISALANAQPIDLISDRPIDVTEAIELGGRDSLVQLVSNQEHHHAKTIASRVFLSASTLADEAIGVDELVNSLVLARDNDRLLASHAVPAAAVDALGRGKVTQFLQLRWEFLRDVVWDFVDSRAEWERPTRPRVGDIRIAAGSG